ncbi:MAG: type IV toxin-antitoxin system AbiEi family antitoxin [bacterium]
MSTIKTNGKIGAALIAKLYDENRSIFTIQDVSRITGLPYFSAGRLISELTARGIISTLKRGKHIIVPQELGSLDTYLGNLYVAVREIVNTPAYYIGFYSAMKYWGMTTQPLLKIFAVAAKRQQPPKSLREKVSFVYAAKKNVWGAALEWVTKTEQVKISNIEKTIIDALAHPEYCGGITEVAKGIWIVKNKIDIRRLIRYVKKYNKNAVAKRLGYLLELFSAADDKQLASLKKYVKRHYDLLDPTIPGKAVGRNHWGLIDNIGNEQILKITLY